MKVKEFVEQHKKEICVIKVYSMSTHFTKLIEIKDNKTYWVNLKVKHIAFDIKKEYEKDIENIEEKETEALDPITPNISKIKIYYVRVKRLANKNTFYKINLGKELVEAKGKFSLWRKEKDMQEQNP